jgi:hypothetical protein
VILEILGDVVHLHVDQGTRSLLRISQARVKPHRGSFNALLTAA